MLNKVCIMGRLTHDPELRSTSGGVSVATFSLAVESDFKNSNGEKITDFFDCIAWRKTAEHICQYFTKGRMMVVDGRLKTDTWRDSSDKVHKSVKIVVDSSYFCDSKKDNPSANQGYMPSAVQSGFSTVMSVPSAPVGNINGFMPAEDDDLPF